MTILAKIRKFLRGIMRPADEAVEFIPDYDLPMEMLGLSGSTSSTIEKLKSEIRAREETQLEKIRKIDEDRLLETVRILLERKKTSPNLIRRVGTLSGNPAVRYSSSDSYERAAYIQDFHDKVQKYYSDLGFYDDFYQMQIERYVEIMKNQRPYAFNVYEKTMRAKNPPSNWEESLAPIREEEVRKRYDDVTLIESSPERRESNYKKFNDLINNISGDKDE